MKFYLQYSSYGGWISFVSHKTLEDAKMNLTARANTFIMHYWGYTASYRIVDNYNNVYHQITIKDKKVEVY